MAIVIAVGKSMENFCGLGIIRYSKYHVYQYKVGDMIVFLGNDNNRYCHRIVRINQVYVTTKGDNYNESKQYEIDVPVQRIQGKVTWHLP